LHPTVALAFADATYLVKDPDLDLTYETSTPKRCPGATAENPPTLLDPSIISSRIMVNFRAPAAADTPSVVYGYKVTISSWDVNSEE
jgi:hypothetical protein